MRTTSHGRTARRRESPGVFISYSSHNRRRADVLARLLRVHGLRVWLDRWDILVGHNIWDEVYKGILRSDFLALVLTRASVRSRWVAEELSIARQRELERRRVVILPLLFERLVIPLHLRRKKYADFRVFDRGFRELLQILNVPPLPSSPTPAQLRTLQGTITHQGNAKQALVRGIIRSFAEARLADQYGVSPSVLAGDASPRARAPNTHAVIIQIDFESLDVSVPLRVHLDQTAEEVLRAVSRVFALPQTFEQLKEAHAVRPHYFLLHDGQPLDRHDALRDCGVSAGAHLKVGCYLTATEYV